MKPTHMFFFFPCSLVTFLLIGIKGLCPIISCELWVLTKTTPNDLCGPSAFLLAHERTFWYVPKLA